MLSGNENSDVEMTDKKTLNKTTKRALRHTKKKSWPALKGWITRTRNQIKKGRQEEKIDPNLPNKKGITLAWELASEGKTDILLDLSKDNYIDLNIAPQSPNSYYQGETVAWWLANHGLMDCLIALSSQCPVDLNKASTCQITPRYLNSTVAQRLIENKRPDLLAVLPHTGPIDLSLTSKNWKIDDIFSDPTISIAQ